jgi:xyloglucan-specific exo-beta-1,4-glucanase
MNGSIILSSAGTGSLFTNTSNGTGSWTQLSCPVGAAYSRCLIPLNNGRLFVIGAGWNGTGLNNVTYADIAFGCTPTAIVPSTQVNGGQWRNSTSDTVSLGGTIVFAPQPTAAAGWSWSGPNGFSASTREVTLSSIAASQAGVYTATYTNPSGCKSTQKFTVTMNTTCILTIYAEESRGSKQLQLRIINNSLSLQLFDKNAEVSIFDLKGRSVYKKLISTNEVVIPGLNTGVYVIDIVVNNVLMESKSFILE